MDKGKKHFTIGPDASNDDSSSNDVSMRSLIAVCGQDTNANSLRSSFTNIVGEQNANGPISVIATGDRSGSWHNFADYSEIGSTMEAHRDTSDSTSAKIR